MRDRLRQVNAPKSIQDAIGGWGREDIGDSYGLGYGLENLEVRFPRFFVFQEVGFMLPVSLSVE
jgi:hypothetical protein